MLFQSFKLKTVGLVFHPYNKVFGDNISANVETLSLGPYHSHTKGMIDFRNRP